LSMLLDLGNIPMADSVWGLDGATYTGKGNLPQIGTYSIP